MKFSLSVKLFSVLTILSLSSIATAFYSWNKISVFEKPPLLSVRSDSTLRVDSCNKGTKTVNVRGWIVSGDYPEKGNLIITTSYNGEEIIIPSFTYERNDISRSLGRNIQHDKIAFNASLSKFMLGGNLSNKFSFYIKNNNGVIEKASDYECK